nr:reverse transcriptase domain-containing protein [Tanacetum cinerariifolium]
MVGWTTIGCWIAMGNVDPYLGGEAHRRACSHGGSHTLLSRPAILNLCLTFSLSDGNDKVINVWGINFIGLFLSSRGNKYILVAVDYLYKWVEAKALPTNDARVICKFLKNLFARFGTPEPLSVIEEPYKTPIGYTLYKLVYEKACHLPIELEHKAYWALKYANFDLQTAGDHRKVQLNELNDLRDQAYENSLIYKEKTKRLHDLKIKDRVFNIGDRVLLFNSQLKIFSGLFLSSRGNKYILVAVDYLYKWVEAKALPTNDARVVCKFLKNLFARFGTPEPLSVIEERTSAMTSLQRSC